MVPRTSDLCAPAIFKRSVALLTVLRNEQEDREVGPPASNELQVSIQATGLCGSDLHYYQHYCIGDIPVQAPFTLGHESAGIVKQIGSDVHGFQIGDSVALEVGIPCSNCLACLGGRYNICKEMRFRGSAKSFPHFQGTFQDRLNHPAASCYK